MDRFIVYPFQVSYSLVAVLKSNMDRFIEEKTADSTAMLSILKSNMDRFIVSVNKTSLRFFVF